MQVNRKLAEAVWSKNNLPRTEAEWVDAVSKKPKLLQYNPAPSDAVQLAAINKDPAVFSNIRNPSEAVQLGAAVQGSGWLMQYIPRPSLAVQLAALHHAGSALNYIKNLDPAVLDDADAKRNIITDMLVKLKQPRVNWGAYMLDGIKILRAAGCDWPEIDTIERSILASNKKVDLNAATEAERLAAVQNDAWEITRIANPSEAVQLAAVLARPDLIQRLANPSEAVQLSAVQQWPWYLEYIHTPTLSTQLAAVKQDGLVIKFITDPSEAVQLAAVKNKGHAIRYIKKPTESAQLAAVAGEPSLIQYIKKPSVPVQLVAVKADGRVIDLWKKLQPVIFNDADAKRSIMTSLLQPLSRWTQWNRLKASDKIRQLRAAGYDWPELDVIERSLNADNTKKLDEVTRQEEADQLAAVERNPYEILDIKDPSQAVQIAALTGDPYVIRWIKNPTPYAQIVAATDAPYEFLKHVKQISPTIWRDQQVKAAMLKTLLKLLQDNRYSYVDVMMFYLNKNNCPWPELDIVKRSLAIANRLTESNSQEETQLDAVERDPYEIELIDDPSEAVQIAAVETDPHVIRYIKKPTPQVQILVARVTPINFLIEVKEISPAVWQDEPAKKKIITTLLKLARNGRYSLASDMLSLLTGHRCPWTELDIIGRSLELVGNSYE